MTSKALKLCFERNFLSRIKRHAFRGSAQTLVTIETKTRKCIFQQQKRRYRTHYIRQTTRKSDEIRILIAHIFQSGRAINFQCTSSHISSTTRNTKKLDLGTSITPLVNPKWSRNTHHIFEIWVYSGRFHADLQLMNSNPFDFKMCTRLHKSTRIKCKHPYRDEVQIYVDYETTSKALKLGFERNFSSRIKGHAVRWIAQTLVSWEKCKTRKCLFQPHKRRCPTHYICQTTRKSHEIRILIAHIFQNDEPSTSMYFFTYFFYHTEYQKVRSWRHPSLLSSMRNDNEIPTTSSKYGFTAAVFMLIYNSWIQFRSISKCAQDSINQPGSSVNIHIVMESRYMLIMKRRRRRWSWALNATFHLESKGMQFGELHKPLFPERNAKQGNVFFIHTNDDVQHITFVKRGEKAMTLGFLLHIYSKMTSHQLQCISPRISSTTLNIKKNQIFEEYLSSHV